MRGYLVPAFGIVLLVAAAKLPSSMPVVSAAEPAAPTFNKDVLPILQRNCQECHRPGAIAPMSFVTYKDTRPYAKAIEKAVVARTMPPISRVWFPDRSCGRKLAMAVCLAVNRHRRLRRRPVTSHTGAARAVNVNMNLVLYSLRRQHG